MALCREARDAAKKGRGAHAAVERRALKLALEGPGDAVEVAAAALKVALQLHAGRVHVSHALLKKIQFRVRVVQIVEDFEISTPGTTSRHNIVPCQNLVTHF
jgi:hypothetical protein